jgi:hypothetical protein
MGIIKNYNDKKWTLQFLDVLYNSIDIVTCIVVSISPSETLSKFYSNKKKHHSFYNNRSPTKHNILFWDLLTTNNFDNHNIFIK